MLPWALGLPWALLASPRFSWAPLGPPEVLTTKSKHHNSIAHMKPNITAFPPGLTCRCPPAVLSGVLQVIPAESLYCMPRPRARRNDVIQKTFADAERTPRRSYQRAGSGGSEFDKRYPAHREKYREQVKGVGEHLAVILVNKKLCEPEAHT